MKITCMNCDREMETSYIKEIKIWKDMFGEFEAEATDLDNNTFLLSDESLSVTEIKDVSVNLVSWKIEEYIDQLEKLVISLSNIYQQNYEEAEKDYIENKNDYYTRMLTVQGILNRLKIARIADFIEKIDGEINLNCILENIKNKYK